MGWITCPHCGDRYPDFDVAHVCSSGPRAPQSEPLLDIDDVVDIGVAVLDFTVGILSSLSDD